MGIQPWFCLHLLLDVAHGKVNMCTHMVNGSIKFAQFLCENHVISPNIRIRTFAADTGELYGVNSGFCRAPWHPSGSKKQQVCSQLPGFYFFWNFLKYGY